MPRLFWRAGFAGKQKALDLDPGKVRRKEKAEQARCAKNTFEAVARVWLEVHATKVTPETLHMYETMLQRFILPLIGNKPIKDLKAPDFLEILRSLEVQGQLYNIKRVSMTCSMIMRFAVATGQADYDPLPSLRGSFKWHKAKHLAAMTDPKDVGRLLRTINAYTGSFVVRCALKIAPYVFARPSELQKARWEDIDFEICEWRYLIHKPHYACKNLPCLAKKLALYQYFLLMNTGS